MVILAWLWVAVIVVPPLIQNGSLDPLLPNHATTPLPPPTTSSAGLTPLASGLALLFTVIMVIITAITLWRLPKAVTDRGDRAIGLATDAILPVVTHHKKMPVAHKQRLGRKLALLIQLVICVMPLLIVPWLQPPGELTQLIVITIGAATSCAGMSAFALAFAIDKPISRIRSRVSRG